MERGFFLGATVQQHATLFSVARYKKWDGDIVKDLEDQHPLEEALEPTLRSLKDHFNEK